MRTFTSLRVWLLAVTLLIPVLGRAQNLLSNPGFEAGNTGFVSGYTYITPTGTSTEAQYTIAPDNRSFNSGFPVSFSDHTTGTGNYLIADGAGTGIDLWEQTVTGLAPNRNYTFSFWLLNVLPGNKARIQVSANGTDVSTAFTNPADGGNWQLNTVTVNPGAGTQLVLRLRNLRLDSSGNDFGLDDMALVLQTYADVTTTLTGPATSGAGQAVGPYTATFSNAGPDDATEVTQTVQLPAGATLTAAQLAALPTGATYDSPTHTITFATGTTLPAEDPVQTVQLPAGATLTAAELAALPPGTTYDSPTHTITFATGIILPAEDPVSYSFSFTAPPTTETVALTSAVTTTSFQTPNTNPDQATRSLTVSAPAAPPTGCRPSYATGSASSGLSADYYAGYFADDLSFFSGATAAVTRIDPQLSYTSSAINTAAGWGPIVPPATRASSNPGDADYYNADNFSARYRGSVYIPTAGAYTFYLTSDDASDMWIDGAALAPTSTNRLINNGGTHGAVTVQATATLSAGLHNVLIYYGELVNGNTLTLEYSSTAGAGIARQLVPNAALCAGATPLPPVATAFTRAPLANVSGPTAIPAPAGTDANAGGSITGFVLASLPDATSGILYVDGMPATTGPLTAAEAATLTFDPNTTFIGNATFSFFAVNNFDQLSNLPATYTIPVTTPIADVTTTLTGPTTLGAGQSSGTYTVTFTNNGPQRATTVTRVVALPTGATLTAAQQAALPGTAVYSSSSNTIDFGTVPVLNNGGSNTFTFSFTSPTTQGSNSLSSTVDTDTPQGTNAGPDQATVNLTVTADNLFVTNDDSNEVPGNTTKSGNVILNDANPANLADANFIVQLVTPPSHGSVVLNADGSYAYTPNSGYQGPDAFTYRVNVPSSTPPNSNTSTVALNVYDASLVCISGAGLNLLANPSFSNPAAGAGYTSSYSYAGLGSNSLVPEGRYTVGTSAASYHPSFVGNGRGGANDNFMMVNGSQNLSVIYQQTVTVQPNRYYTFSAYASNIGASSPARLGFVINGKSTSTVTTLPGAGNSYVQLVDLWFSGSNTTAVIEIRDVNKDTNGNDFGLDDLYIGTCAVSLTVNDITNGMMSNAAPARSVLPLNATVTNGPPVGSYTIQTLPDPATGILYLNGLPVIPGQIITIAEASLLQFDPVAGYVGNAVFTYSGSDTSGAGSNNIATFTIPIDNTPLPVELTDFEAAVNNRDAHLTWHTASEKNSDHFDIERSFDGKSFARVSAVAGQGNTTRPTAYAYTDAGVGRSHNGTVYYRLRQVDHDGTATHSPVRSVVFKESASIALSFYPNPTTGSGTLDLSKLPTGSYQVTVVDATGRQVLSTALSGGEQHPMALDGLARGNYLLVVRGRGGLKLSQRVVRE